MFSFSEFLVHGIVAVSLGLITIPVSHLFYKAEASNLDGTHSSDMSGMLCIVTGGNTGIGKRTALHMCLRGAHVIIACRDKSRATQAVRDIQTEIKTTSRLRFPHSTKGKIEYMILDLSSLPSVWRFSKQFNSQYNKLDVLINNGGINTPGPTSYGLQKLFLVNYLSHYFLFRLMEPALLRAASARVVNLSSVTHHTGQPDFEMSAFSRYPRGIFAPRYSYYSDSKLYMNLLTLAINKRYYEQSGDQSGGIISAVSVNPGAVRSDIWRSVPSLVHAPYDLFMRALYLTVDQGSATSVFAATSTIPTFPQKHHRERKAENFCGHPLVPYVVPYKMYRDWLCFEMIGPFAQPQWAKVSLPSSSDTLAVELWEFSTGLINRIMASEHVDFVNLR
mmetsp:Transcript_14426/g.21674  ORF Transcript_14426/g.21674 Transcript_14426/m.21674 type:complete len:391 (+) Transcript_14426:43-1215(+)